ncbi:hypothetical protein IMG5_124180 [Ichthyophthirius multifiliis]|uniref:Obg-like ATPase 1 n=1 Tax=Ichthyophthirius multifiliis TaxID=5932 RepID=G0QVJ2_ICHMU|nr:hypothetical protein IMG5_124180 [Ichthyophthirius multifiliis]EGR30752.1 hypothetical protein IMG5_124180 [Ichthyophthirius multifiliis]|eukprot:XP_004032339.1 hypothetical protein IMG5_124180 [Ichthyophthirius multifiliis]
MPPKKEEVHEKKIKLGRPGNTLKMGIVGLPNVGKSTTFNLLSKLNIPAENYPFCTIDPNLAKVYVDDQRFHKLCEMHQPKSKIPATLSIMDIAGLVPGASKGEGLGNAFLSHIRETDGIFHVVRAFDDPEIAHTENEVDPINRFNDKESKDEKEVLDKVDILLKQKKWVFSANWLPFEVEIINKYMFLTAKTVVYLVNLSAEDFQKKKNKWLPKIKDWVTNNCPGEMIPYSADYEKKLIETNDTKNSMMSRIIRTGYKALDLIYFFTAGPDEVRAWTIREDTKAPQAAGVIHTDFEKGFICAEIMKYDDYVAAGSENALKSEGKYYQKGKDYVVQDADIIFFKFNVSQSKKK